MSVNLTGVTFYGQQVTDVDHATLQNSVLTDGIVSGCAITYSGLNVTVAPGRLIACGREVRLDNSGTLELESSHAYARIKLVINMAANNIASLQVDYTNGNNDSFPSLTQENINENGTVYEVPICILSMSNNAISAIAYTAMASHAKPVALQATLAASSWQARSNSAGYKNHIYNVNIKPNDNIIAVPSPNEASRTAWMNCDVYLSYLQYGTIHFYASAIPANDIVVNLLIL